MRPYSLAVLLALLPVPALPVRAQPGPPPTVALNSLRDRNRVLLVFGNGDNALASQQLQVAAANADGFRQRDLLLVGIYGSDPSVPAAMLSASGDAAARKQFKITPGQFTVVLLGKDGGEKLRSEKPIAWGTLRATIDSMPMRQSEMRKPPQ